MSKSGRHNETVETVAESRPRDYTARYASRWDHQVELRTKISGTAYLQLIDYAAAQNYSVYEATRRLVLTGLAVLAFDQAEKIAGKLTDEAGPDQPPARS